MKAIDKIKEEISTWSYFAKTLTQEHQQSMKYEILGKVENLKSELKEENESNRKKE